MKYALKFYIYLAYYSELSFSTWISELNISSTRNLDLDLVRGGDGVHLNYNSSLLKTQIHCWLLSCFGGFEVCHTIVVFLPCNLCLGC